MTDIWLPPSARGTAEISPGIEVKAVDSETADRLLGPDDAIFLPGTEWSIYHFDPGEDRYHRPKIPAVKIDFERLRQRVIDGSAVAELYGISSGFGLDDGTLVPFPDGPQPYVCCDDCHIYINTKGPEPAPDWWLPATIPTGFLLRFDAVPDGRVPWLATGPLHGDLDRDPIIVPGTRRGDGNKPGRNQQCPCGTGLKFKRCCGR